MEHQKIYDKTKMEYYFFTWSIPNVSSINNLSVGTVDFKMHGGYKYSANLNVSEHKIVFTIISNCSTLTCFVSMFIDSKILLLSNSLNKRTRGGVQPHYYSYYDLVTLSSGDETFQKLKQNPGNTLVLTCRIINRSNNVSSGSVEMFDNTSNGGFNHLRKLADALKNSSESSMEKVLLRVGEESETVIKAILCARSSVFAKMFQSDMKELRSNTVNVTDITMPVLRVLVSFLYTGQLPNCDFNFLCDLYYAADKYDIPELRQLCVDLLLPKISMENVIRFWKFADSHEDVILKSSAVAFIATNIEKWHSSNGWKNLVNDEPKIAVEVLNFLNI